MRAPKLLSLTSLVPVLALAACSSAEGARASVGVAAQVLSPAPGETGVASDAVIVVRLSLPISRTTARDGLVLLDASGRRVSGTLSFDTPTTVVFQPDAPLRHDSAYTVCLTGLVTSTGRPVTHYVLDDQLGIQAPLDDGCYTFSTTSRIDLRHVAPDPKEHVARIYLSEPCDPTGLSDVQVVSCDTRKPLPFHLRYAPTVSRLTVAVAPDSVPLDRACVTLPAHLETVTGVALGHPLQVPLGHPL